MSDVLSILAIAVAAFVSTNVDDMLVLVIFFSRRDIPASRVVAGQYIGIAALAGVSLVIAAAAQALASGWTHWLGILPIAIGLKWLITLLRSRASEEGAAEGAVVERSRPAGSTSQMLYVALVTFANGGDNIGVYSPMFVNSGLPAAVGIIGVFAVLTGAWCAAAFLLTHNAALEDRAMSAGRVLAPWVLIAIGAKIVLEM